MVVHLPFNFCVTNGAKVVLAPFLPFTLSDWRGGPAIRFHVASPRYVMLDVRTQQPCRGGQHEVFCGPCGTNESQKMLLALWFKSARQHLRGPARHFGAGNT